MQRYTDIKVWQRSHELALHVYRVTKKFPIDERYGLTIQLRRAAVSVPTNVAEGTKRQTSVDYGRFLNVAQGSLAEVDYLLLLSRDLGYVDAQHADKARGEVDEIAGMLHRLREKVLGSA